MIFNTNIALIMSLLFLGCAVWCSSHQQHALTCFHINVFFFFFNLKTQFPNHTPYSSSARLLPMSSDHYVGQHEMNLSIITERSIRQQCSRNVFCNSRYSPLEGQPCKRLKRSNWVFKSNLETYTLHLKGNKYYDRRVVWDY